MGKTPQSAEDLERHRSEQFAFLERSADAYDRGFVDEAKRLAATIRLLVHDTKNQKSLLGLLGALDRPFLDTAVPDEPGNLLPHGALVQMLAGPAGATWIPYLDDPLPRGAPRQTSFNEWWNTTIFRNAEGFVLSRRDLVLNVADRDGGVHVDTGLDDVYMDLSRKAGLGWQFEGPSGSYVVRPPELAAVRQIAHELLKTFDPTIDKHPDTVAGAVVMTAGGMFVQSAQAPPSHEPPRAASTRRFVAKVGRNEPCPCGSGRKYKRCHGG